MAVPQCTNGSYTAPVGLEFAVYCGSNVLGYDILSAPGTSLEGCMIQCSVGQGPGGQGPCQGVSYITSTPICWSKDGNVTYQELAVTNGIDTAIAKATQFRQLDSTCPFRNQTLQNTSNGMTFQIDCRKDAFGSDFDWAVDPYYAPQHVGTLEECMTICSEGHSLCYGVVFNPDLQRGYHNCYPKSTNMSGKTEDNPWIMHTALAQISYNTTCDSGTYVTTSNRTFNQQYDQTTDGLDNGQIYMPNLAACVTYCATYINGSQSCSAAVYQPTAADQYENCYLKASSQYAYAQRGYNLAILASSTVNPSNATNTLSSTSAGAPKSTSTAALSTSNGDGSKSWIASAVICPLAGVALLIGAAFWWRRRHHSKHDKSSQTEITEAPSYQNFSAPAYSTSSIAGRNEVEANNVQRSELDENNVKHEMP